MPADAVLCWFKVKNQKKILKYLSNLDTPKGIGEEIFYFFICVLYLIVFAWLALVGYQAMKPRRGEGAQGANAGATCGELLDRVAGQSEHPAATKGPPPGLARHKSPHALPSALPTGTNLA